MISLNQNDVPAAAVSVLATLKKQNHIAMANPAIKYE
jgi:hypothetical protein